MVYKTKKLFVRLFLGTLALVWYVHGAQVTLQPIYSDTRFQPSDQLHAWCITSADVLVAPQWQKIKAFTIVLSYDPERLEIVRVLPKKNIGITNSKIEYDKIILEVQNPLFDTATASSFFEIYFKGTLPGNEFLTLGTGSEVITSTKTSPLQGTFTLSFAKVPECEPDIIPPSLSLVYPKDTTQRISLDQHFVFDIKDTGKGVDKQSVVILFDGEEYTYGTDNIKRNGNLLTFYPGTWIPINTPLDLTIAIDDKQIYGGANHTENVFNFTSATGMLLQNTLTPMMFRQIVQKAQKIAANSGECMLLGARYPTLSPMDQFTLKSLLQKIGCDLGLLDTAELFSWTPWDTDHRWSFASWFSVFATLWWILFLITFSLKIHYVIAYRKHKKMHKKLSSQ